MKKNKKIKTLICILGQTRAHEITWKNFNNFVLKSLNADLAICVAEKKTGNNQMYKNAKYIWKYKDIKDYTRYYENTQKKLIQQNNLKIKPNWKKLKNIKHFWLAGLKGTFKIRNNKGIYAKGSGGLLIYNRWFLLQNIIKHKLIDKYERFVITRSDFIWNTHHPRMENLNPDYIWIPDGEKYGGYTDRHAVLSKENIVDYLNLIEPILLEPDKLYNLMKTKKNWNLERYIKLYFKLKGYSKKVRFFPYIMFSVRNSKIKTTFRPGEYSYKHKYFIKYFKEYLSSVIMTYLIGGEKKEYSNFKSLNLAFRILKNLFKIRIFLEFFLRNKIISDKYDQEFIKKNLENKILL